VAVAVISAAVVLIAFFGWRLQSQVKAATDRATVAQQKADAAWNDAAKQIEAVRQEGARQQAETREMTLRAQRMSDVAAAPDLIRFNLAGADGATGQAMFSRSRGVVVNGWRLPALPETSSYQAWLLTRTTPVKAGTLLAGADGSAVLAQPTPVVPRAVIGVMVSQEPSESVETPSSAPVLSSVVPAAPQPPSEQQ
jgi:Flp pilus assembly protein TadB